MTNQDFEIAGAGSPTIVLIGPASAWDTVWAKLMAVSQIVRYDDGEIEQRLHINPPYSLESVESDLWSLIITNQVNGPFVLVGHSIGGLIAQYLARRRPEDVCGVVLIDSVHPMQRSRFYDYSADAGKFLQEEIEQWLGYLDYEKVEAELQAAPDMRSQMPLLVLSRGIESGIDVGPLWRQLQSELAEQSKRARHVTVGTSRHAIQFDAPQAVIDEISAFVVSLR